MYFFFGFKVQLVIGITCFFKMMDVWTFPGAIYVSKSLELQSRVSLTKIYSLQNVCLNKAVKRTFVVTIAFHHTCCCRADLDKNYKLTQFQRPSSATCLAPCHFSSRLLQLEIPSTLEFYPFCQPLTDIQVRAARIDGIDFKFRSHSRLCESQLNLD